MSGHHTDPPEIENEPDLVPNGDEFAYEIGKRHRIGALWRAVFQVSIILGVIALSALLINIINSNVGYAAFEYGISPDSLARNGVPLEALSRDQLAAVFKTNVSKGLYRRYESEMPYNERTQKEMRQLVYERVVEKEVVKTWTFFESMLKKDEIEILRAEKYPDSFLEFTSWSWDRCG
jgi:hypothetical protein